MEPFICTLLCCPFIFHKSSTINILKSQNTLHNLNNTQTQPHKLISLTISTSLITPLAENCWPNAVIQTSHNGQNTPFLAKPARPCRNQLITVINFSLIKTTGCSICWLAVIKLLDFKINHFPPLRLIMLQLASDTHLNSRRIHTLT